jgi:hypothetical protein
LRRGLRALHPKWEFPTMVQRCYKAWSILKALDMNLHEKSIPELHPIEQRLPKPSKPVLIILDEAPPPTKPPVVKLNEKHPKHLETLVQHRNVNSESNSIEPCIKNHCEIVSWSSKFFKTFDSDHYLIPNKLDISVFDDEDLRNDLCRAVKELLKDNRRLFHRYLSLYIHSLDGQLLEFTEVIEVAVSGTSERLRNNFSFLFPTKVRFEWTYYWRGMILYPDIFEDCDPHVALFDAVLFGMGHVPLNSGGTLDDEKCLAIVDKIIQTLSY